MFLFDARAAQTGDLLVDDDIVVIALVGIERGGLNVLIRITVFFFFGLLVGDREKGGLCVVRGLGLRFQQRRVVCTGGLWKGGGVGGGRRELWTLGEVV